MNRHVFYLNMIILVYLSYQYRNDISMFYKAFARSLNSKTGRRMFGTGFDRERETSKEASTNLIHLPFAEIHTLRKHAHAINCNISPL